MQNLIVLGIIPGTNIQVGFMGWVGIAAIVWATSYSVRRTRQAQAVRFLQTYVSLSFATRRK